MSEQSIAQRVQRQTEVPTLRNQTHAIAVRAQCSTSTCLIAQCTCGHCTQSLLVDSLVPPHARSAPHATQHTPGRPEADRAQEWTSLANSCSRCPRPNSPSHAATMLVGDPERLRLRRAVATGPRTALAACCAPADIAAAIGNPAVASWSEDGWCRGLAKVGACWFEPAPVARAFRLLLSQGHGRCPCWGGDPVGGDTVLRVGSCISTGDNDLAPPGPMMRGVSAREFVEDVLADGTRYLAKFCWAQRALC